MKLKRGDIKKLIDKVLDEEKINQKMKLVKKLVKMSVGDPQDTIFLRKKS